MQEPKFIDDAVFNCDVFDLINVMPNNSLDLVIVDPPYGTSGDTDGYGRSGKTILNDEDEEINYRFLRAVLPKMKRDTSLYIFASHHYMFEIKEAAMAMGYAYKAMCIMVKNNMGMGGGFRNQYEVCIVLEKGEAKYNLKSMSNVWHMKHIKHDDASHPHQKGYEIIRNIILHSSHPHDLVFDGFMGSFSTAIACHKERRHFIGSELDPRWFKLGSDKLANLRSAPELDF